MNVVREINAINQKELELGLSASWHDEHKDNARIHVGGIHKDLTEGDVITIFSQYGEIMDINMPRDKETGKNKGFAFLMYEDQRSTVLAVDNLNGAKVLERTLKVDHAKNYRQPKKKDGDGEWIELEEESMNARPELINDDGDGSDSSDSSGYGDIDPEDPMRDYLIAKRKEEKAAKGKKDKKKSKGKHKDETPEERAARKARKKEKKAKKAKKGASKSEGVKAVEDLLNSLGRGDLGASRSSRSRSPTRDRRSRSRSPPPRHRHRSPSEDYEPRRKRSRYSDDEDRFHKDASYSGRERNRD